MEDRSGIDSASSSSELLNLESLSSLTRELTEIPTSSNDVFQLSSSESEKLLKNYAVDFESKMKQFMSASPDFSSMGSENLDAYLKDAMEELKLVVAAKSLMSDEIKVLTRAYVEDSTRLESDLEGLSCSLKLIESQGFDKLQTGSHVGCFTSLEGKERPMNTYEDYKFEVLELDDKIENSKVILSCLKDLHYNFQRVEDAGWIEDSFTGLKVIEFEGNCLRLSLKTFVPTSEGLFYQQRLESSSVLPALEHELLIEFFDRTMELKNVEIFPNDVVIDEIIDAVKSSRKFIPSLSTMETRFSLEWLVREVQNLIILSVQNQLQLKDAIKSRN